MEIATTWKPPVDQLAPGEIAEGKETAFGITLPRKMTITARFADTVFARGDLTIEDTTRYVRQRVVAERVDVGPAKTVFTKATSKSDPGKILAIEIVSVGNGSQLVLRDATPPPPEPGLSEEERWKKLGLSPQGKLLDPTHLE